MTEPTPQGRAHERLVAVATLTTVSALRVGASDHAGNLLEVARTFDGDLYLPGTSLAGVLRQRCDRLFGQQKAAGIFGGEVPMSGGKVRLQPSRLVVDDAPLVSAGPEPTTTATRVALDRRRDSAAATLLFTEQLVRAGAAFRFQLTLNEPDDETERLFAALLTSVENEGISVGAGTRSGRGRLRLTSLQIRRQRLADQHVLRAWLTAPDRAMVGELIDPSQWLRFDPGLGAGPLQPAVRISLGMELLEPILVGGASGDPNVAEIQPLTDGSLGIAGTSWRGALRSRAERIHATLRGPQRTWWDPARAQDTTPEEPAEDDLPARLFGSTSHAGSVWISDAVFEGEIATQQFAHVALDRWTGGAAAHRLFGTMPVLTGRLSLEVEARTDDPVLIGLLVLVLLDLATGDLPVGSRRYRGMGALAARSVTFSHCGGLPGLAGAATWTHHGPVLVDAPGRAPTRAEIIDALDPQVRDFVTECVRRFAEVTT